MLCLSVDIDWAPDAVIRDCLALIARSQVKTTWFATHATPVLDEIRATPGHEIGLHPNFNPVLQGQNGSADSVLAGLRGIVPDARIVRSHSLVRSSRLSALFGRAGLTHESNLFVHPRSAATLVPWRCITGLIQIPIVWADDVRLADATIGEPVDWVGKVPILTVDFHPIHVYLNSRTMEDYDKARPDYHNPEALQRLRSPMESGGTRDRLIRLLEAVQTETLRNHRLTEIQVG